MGDAQWASCIRRHEIPIMIARFSLNEMLADTYEIPMFSALLPSRIQTALWPPCKSDRLCAVHA